MGPAPPEVEVQAFFDQRIKLSQTFLVARWLKTHASTAGSTSTHLIPGQGTKILHAMPEVWWQGGPFLCFWTQISLILLEAGGPLFGDQLGKVGNNWTLTCRTKNGFTIQSRNCALGHLPHRSKKTYLHLETSLWMLTVVSLVMAKN